MLRNQLIKFCNYYKGTSQFVPKFTWTLNQNRTLFQSHVRFDGYQGDGKTVATSLNDEIGKYLIVNSYNSDGFHLSNGSFAYGSIILFPNVLFRWNVKTFEDINIESLTLFKLIYPKLDLLLIGIGDSGIRSSQALVKLRKEISSFGIKAELMPTRDAIATYNFMLSDFRVVAGAFLPPMSKIDHKLLSSSSR